MLRYLILIFVVSLTAGFCMAGVAVYEDEGSGFAMCTLTNGDYYILAANGYNMAFDPDNGVLQASNTRQNAGTFYQIFTDNPTRQYFHMYTLSFGKHVLYIADRGSILSTIYEVPRDLQQHKLFYLQPSATIGYCRIISAVTHEALTIADASRKDGDVDLVLMEDKDTVAQQWMFTPAFSEASQQWPRHDPVEA